MQEEGKLPYLLVQPVFALSGSGVTAIKWGYGVAFLLGAAGVYAWARRWLGNRGGALAATVYTYLPWHLSTVYDRGAYAEAWLWAFWPLLLWSVDQLEGRSLAATLAWLAAGGALLAATFWIQAGLAALCLPLLVAYALLVHLPRRRAVPGQGSTLLALALLCLLISIQAVAAQTATTQAATGTADSPPGQFLYPSQLFSDARHEGLSEGLSFQMGTVAVGLGLVALALGATGRSDLPAQGAGLQRNLWFFAAALLVIVVLTLPLSASFWRLTSLETLVARPWQVLALAGLPLAFLAGATVRVDHRLAALPALAGLLALVVLASSPHLAPDFTQVDPGSEPVAAFHPTPAGVGLATEQRLATGQLAEAGATQILLLDYVARPPTAIMPTLTLTLTWQAIALPQQAVASVEGDYTVFVHLLDREGEKVAQRDSRPCDGECPTDGWQPGRIVTDRHTLTLPPNAQPGPYRLAVGLYLLGSGERAGVLGRDDDTVYLDVP